MVERIADTFNHFLPWYVDAGVFVPGPEDGVEVREQPVEIGELHDKNAFFAVRDVVDETAHVFLNTQDIIEEEGSSVFTYTLFEKGADVWFNEAGEAVRVNNLKNPCRCSVAVTGGNRIPAHGENSTEHSSRVVILQHRDKRG